jgi:hypothetical protein
MTIQELKDNVSTAMRMIPSSRLWGDDRGANTSNLNVVYSEMDIGEAAFMLASTFHGRSTNHSWEGNKLVYAMFMCKGTLRQEFDTLVEYLPRAVKG